MQYKVKAGRFIFDKQSKKVKVSKEKGLIHILRNEEQETHFKWINLDTNLEEFDIIVFATDAVFEQVVEKNNTFVLRFGMDDQRYFFWLQEKCDVQHAITEINRLINYEEPANEMEDEGSAVKQEVSQPPQPEHKPQAQTHAQPSAQPIFQPSNDFIAKLAQGLAAATKKQHRQKQTAITHLSQVITPEALKSTLKQFTKQQLQNLLQFLPQQHKDPQHITSTVHSPQFLQAMDVLSDALNTENALPLFMEIGLNQQHLHRHYGVQAFLLALIEKFRKKQEEMKD